MPSEDHPDFHYTIPTTAKQGNDAARIDHILETIIADVDNAQYPVISVCLEDYGPINKFSGKIEVRAEIVGCIKRHLRTVTGIPYYTVSPLGLKKYATGHGGTKKGEKSKDGVFQAAADLGFETKASDEVDAFFCARLMRDIIAGNRLDVSYNRFNPKGYTF